MDLSLLDGVDIEAFLDSATPEEIEAVHDYMEAIEAYKKYNKIEFYQPQVWQSGVINKGRDTAIRGLIAANRIGKSDVGTYELAIHLTGRYPEGWDGYRFNGPIDTLALGVDLNTISKPDQLQEKLLGKLDDRGTGFIPKDTIVEIKNKVGMGSGVAESVRVTHYDAEGNPDGVSRLLFGSYSQGQDVLMGLALQFVLIDEMPTDDAILPQCIKRTWSFRGDARVLCTFTPERGISRTVSSFWDEKGTHHSGLLRATLWDADIYTQEEKEMMASSIPPWQKSFSIEGIPSAGTGAVFQGIVKQNLTSPDLSNIPSHWKRLAAADIGFQDDFVVQFGAECPDTGELWVYDEMTFQQTDAIIIANAVKARQAGYIPLLLPRDAKFERGLGTTFQKIFRDAGCLMTDELAANWLLQPDGKNIAVAPGIMHLRDLMVKTLFKITFKADLFLKEFDMYSYDNNGKFKDKYNHSIDTCRYLSQGISRFGVSEKEAKQGKANEVSRNEWHDYNEEFEGY